MNDQCGECRRLWQEYAAATMAHVQLDNKFKLAALTGDNAMIRVLSPQTERAGAARKLLREAIRTHDLHIHDETAAAGSNTSAISV
jgi:hypothetical protein